MAIDVIDISYCQPKVDFVKVKAAGVKAVIIRNGYKGKTDTHWKSHVEGAIAAGIDIGTYTYIMANTRAEAVAEAKETLKRLEPYKGHINYPVFCDMESEKYYKKPFDKAKRTSIIKAFCEVIRNGGYYPALYINPSWLEEWTDKSQLLGKYDIWLAAWTENKNKPTKYNYGQKMWQYGTCRVNGISGEVDGNLCYVDYPEIIRKAGKNYLPKESTVTITATKTVPASQVAQYAGKVSALGFAVKTE